MIERHESIFCLKIPHSAPLKHDRLLFQTILGDFQKEQEKFVQEKNAKKTGTTPHRKRVFVRFCIFTDVCVCVDAAVPPWVGYSEEETIQQQILALSAVSFRSMFKSFGHLIILDNGSFCLRSGQEELPA